MYASKNSCNGGLGSQFRKTSLAMSLAIGLGGISTQPMAALSTSTLQFDLGVITVSCNYGTTPPCNKAAYSSSDVVGSWFSMDTNKDGIVAPPEKTRIGSLNGIVMGTTQAASGSHSNSINGTENPNIDAPWEFFGNTGMHQTTSAPADLTGAGTTRTLDLSGWNVTWNCLPSIPLVPTGPAIITCDTAACGNNDPYTVNAPFHVSGAGFTSVAYTLHLEGKVLAGGVPPTAGPVNAKTIVGNPVNINVLDSVTSSSPIVADSINIPRQGTSGTATGLTDNSIDYATTNPAFSGMDDFDYTVDNTVGPSNEAQVTVDVQANVSPVANPNELNTNPAAFDNAGGMIEIDVLADDTDVNNDPGLPGGIDITTVNITAPPSTGACTADAVTGKVTYSQTLPTVPVSTSCSYEVSDIDTAAAPLVSNVTTIDINVTAIQSDWPFGLDPAIIPFLIFEDGVPDPSGNTALLPVSGSYFSMEVDPGNTTVYVTMIKGPSGGFVIGFDQPAEGSHQNVPDGSESTSVDQGWNFFGNTGMSWTKNGGIVGNPDGTLKFDGTPAVSGGQGKYQITWNGIPEIDLGGSPGAFPEDLGFGTILCNPAPCTDGSTFDLAYAAHVPPGDPSNFGGVQYGLVMNGTVNFLDSAFQTSDGTFTNEQRSQKGDPNIPVDADSERQCIGGCFDYTITGVTDPSVSVVLPLNGGVPSTGSGEILLRVLSNGVWGNFDTTAGDSVLSAAFVAGGTFGTVCPAPGDAAYGALTEGHQCLQVTIADNGPNDKDNAAGTITDPSGLGQPTFVPPPDKRKSGDSGCTIATTPVSPLRGGAWWLLAGLAAWMGWNRRKSKQH